MEKPVKTTFFFFFGTIYRNKAKNKLFWSLDRYHEICDVACTTLFQYQYLPQMTIIHKTVPDIKQFGAGQVETQIIVS